MADGRGGGKVRDPLGMVSSFGIGRGARGPPPREPRLGLGLGLGLAWEVGGEVEGRELKDDPPARGEPSSRIEAEVEVHRGRAWGQKEEVEGIGPGLGPRGWEG